MDTQTTTATEVKVPDIGDFMDVPIIDIHVKVGDPVNAEDPLITLESDKATMDVPAPSAGTIRQVLVKVGDRVNEGTPIVLLAGNEEGAMQQPTSLLSQQEPVPAAARPPTPAAAPPTPAAAPPTLAAAPTPAAAAPAVSVGAQTAGAQTDFSGVHARRRTSCRSSRTATRA
jgi:pyruvate dehydrogenase E2 component (dihydrolipoamide acetyltransferase)